MRRALTLIELILSMVIIAIVFTVIPRLIHAMNQTSKTAQQEEAMYNAVALMGAIINLPWDNNNSINDQILQVNSGNIAYDCNTTSGYRIGGFVGGRNCIEPAGADYNASTLGLEGSDINDIDDYVSSFNVDNNCSRAQAKFLYTLTPTITYVNDPSATGNIDLNLTTQGANLRSNTKHIQVGVGYHSNNKFGGCITALQYDAFNIGQIHINSRSW